MRPFDFAPLYRSTIGFDRLARLLDQAAGADTGGGAFPPYNIERTGDNAFQVTLAVAGFSEADLTIELNEQVLTVSGEKIRPEAAADGTSTPDRRALDGDRQFLHRGIAGRSFARRFQLADHVEVSAATIADGLLHIDLVRNVPERLKPRHIAIGRTGPNRPVEVTSQLTSAA
jgi:molecular chaperone IbpA